MPTKTTDRGSPRLAPGTPGASGPIFANTVAYWLEDDFGNRVSKMFGASDKPLELAGRALENVGHLAGWTVARRDTAGARHIVACGPELELLATPFMPGRTPAETQALQRFNQARRSEGFRRANVVTDERIY